jgi:serine/threonine protein kinase
VWSIGVIAYMLLSGTPPFHGQSDAETLAAVKAGNWKFEESLFDDVSMHAKDFITQCLNRNYTKRISAQEALELPWFGSLLRDKRGFSEKIGDGVGEEGGEDSRYDHVFMCVCMWLQ